MSNINAVADRIGGSESTTPSRATKRPRRATAAEQAQATHARVSEEIERGEASTDETHRRYHLGLRGVTFEKASNKGTGMADQPEYKNGELIFSAFNPEGQPFTVKVTRQRLRFLAQSGAWRVEEATQTVGEVLNRPLAIFAGIRQEDDENKGPNGVGWWCYAGVSSTRFLQGGSVRTAKSDEIFLVFVTDEFVAYNSRWELASPRPEWFQDGYLERFRRRIFLRS